MKNNTNKMGWVIEAEKPAASKYKFFLQQGRYNGLIQVWDEKENEISDTQEQKLFMAIETAMNEHAALCEAEAALSTLFRRRAMRFRFPRFLPLGQPPSFAFSLAASAFAGDEILPSIAAGLISFPQCGHFMVAPIVRPSHRRCPDTSCCEVSSGQVTAAVCFARTSRTDFSTGHLQASVARSSVSEAGDS